MSRSSFSTVEKLTIINLIRNVHYSINEVASMYNLNWSTIRSWIHKFETLGEAGLEEAKSNTSYSNQPTIRSYFQLIDLACDQSPYFS
ncbi:helix-turn-helix domain-containing protein [Pontibacillus yanchengensis]|uniref:Helix-turn-helix domain-containing protein n=1 Tax=Pontibacillus yanchengensis TaxID=462910 RepID=A0A6I5A229_9BACI|nr:helix-turn-helix domain-containing protein [Pontibacillus yanchengensis]MYL34663.1 helix-turn-helix domain-containing protein [Pontibacillus yanchengensis]